MLKKLKHYSAKKRTAQAVLMSNSGYTAAGSLPDGLMSLFETIHIQV